MTRPMMSEGSRRRIGASVDARRLWSGGVASAVVAGLVALVGVLVSRWIFNVPVLAPRRDGAFGDVRTAVLVLVAVAAALVATGLAHLLMLSTPRPLLFFGWIVALITIITVVFPFSTGARLDAKIATAIVYLAIGLATGTLVGGVAGRSVMRTRLPASELPPPPYDRPQPHDRTQPDDRTQPHDRTQPYDLGRPGNGYR